MTTLNEHHIYTKSPITSYHMESKLLMQFILFEMLQAYNEITTIRDILSNVKLTGKGRFTASDRKKLDTLVHSIKNLSGQTHHHHLVFTWNLTEGILAKLKYYCGHLANDLDEVENDASKIKKNSDRAWIHSLEMLDHLRLIRLVSSKSALDLAGLNEIFKKMIRRTDRLSKVVSNVLGRFREDENVMLFLLRYQTQLDRIYGDDFVFTLFRRFYEGGVEEAKAMITKKYNKRQFYEVLPKTKTLETTTA